MSDNILGRKLTCNTTAAKMTVSDQYLPLSKESNFMVDKLKGKVAAVTGSGQGIGKAIAIALAKEGAKVVTNNRKPGSTGYATYGDEFLNSLSPERRDWVLKQGKELSGDSESTAKEIKDMGGEAMPFYGDVSNFEVAQQFIQTAVDSFGKIDILVNNAGTFMHAPVWKMTEQQWDHVTGNKPKSAFNTIRHAAPYMMKQKWGRIINCTSGAWLGAFDHCNYSAANGGVVGLSRAIARELLPHGITCNVYGPSAMTRAIVNLVTRAWVMAEKGTPILPQEIVKQMENRPDAKSLAPFIAYLATEEASNISGTVFAVRSFGPNGPEMGIYSEPELKKVIAKKEGWTVEELIEQVPKVLLEGYQSPATAAQITKY